MSRSFAAPLAPLLAAALAAPAVAADAPADAEKAGADAAPAVDFARDVQPLLAKRCLACHGPDDAEGGLMLGSHDSALAATDSGAPAIVPGDAAGSELLRRVMSHEEWEMMPPEGDRLTADEVATLRAWIDGGAEWADHWAFEEPTVIDPPAVTHDGPAFVRNEIDQFVQRRLEAAGSEPNPPADRVTLLRRLSFDLTGLPPSPEEAAAFAADEDPLAYEQAVDRMLASPAYGEKWGRHWLDLVRYAQTNSYERDGEKPNAWKYRDYVIRSLNDDKPYDRFVLEQLAGDELPASSADERRELMTATGYYRLGLWDDEPADQDQAIYDELDDLVRTTSEGVLGLTVGCARCHDHKLDPIPQDDYYKLVAVFRDVTPYGDRGDQTGNNQADVTPPEVAEAHRALDAEFARWNERKTEIEQRGIAQMSAPDQRATEGGDRERRRVLRRELKKHLSEVDWEARVSAIEHLEGLEAKRKALPPRETVLGLARKYAPGEIPATFTLARGNPQGADGDELAPGVPTLFGEELAIEPGEDSAGRRLAFARWAVSPDNRLTARVAVNRVWQHHFGRGLVRSSNNFGKLGTPPTHPDLLDWLADAFATEDGWSLKSLHRRIVTSAAYRRSSGPNERCRRRGPAERPVLAVRPPPADRRRAAGRLPRRHRRIEPGHVRPELLPGVKCRGPRRPVQARRRLGRQPGRGAGAAGGLFVHQAERDRPGPGGLRLPRDRRRLRGPVQHRPARPGPGTVERRLPKCPRRRPRRPHRARTAGGVRGGADRPGGGPHHRPPGDRRGGRRRPGVRGPDAGGVRLRRPPGAGAVVPGDAERERVFVPGLNAGNE